MSLSTTSTSIFPSFNIEPKAPVSSPSTDGFDPAVMHPASLIPLSEMSDFTEKVVQKRFNEIHPASLPSPTHLVRDGYGELVLRVKEHGVLRSVTRDEYAKAYRIFQKYAPRLDAHPTPLAKSRIEMMREELRTINPNMVATFIPRTLHDLIFLRKSIEEDIERESHHPFKNPKHPTEEEIEELELRSSKNSWFTDPAGKEDVTGFPRLEICMPSDVEKNLPALLDVGYRLNLAATAEIDRLGANIEDLSLQQIQDLVDDQINFLERFAKDRVLRRHFKHLTDWDAPLTDFALRRFTAEPKISCEEQRLYLRKIVLIECQESMARKILCYRGGTLATDSPIKNKTYYSLSLGNALFSGLVNDIGACAYYHMFLVPDRIDKDDAYILVLDPAIESSQTFHIPSYTALESLFGCGEIWHYRFKSSKEVHTDIAGITLTGKGFKDVMSKMEKLAQIKGPFTRQQTVDKFEDLKKNNVILVYNYGAMGRA
jgi:hypothetical protein